MQPTILISILRKIFNPGNLSYLLLAAPGSVSLNRLLDVLLEETPIKALLLPLLVTAASLSLYFIIFLLDFLSGVKASRHEAGGGDYFSSAKGWSSMWKLATVSVLVTWSSFFSMLAAIGGMEYLSTFFLFSAGTIAIMASLLDVYSIGENQKRLTGKKARIFVWFENVRRLFNNLIIRRFENLNK